MATAHRPSRPCISEILHLPAGELVPDPNNARKHSKRQLVQLIAAIREFGFTNPLLIDEHRNVIAGHARLDAARSLGMETVPCIEVTGLTDTQRRALAISDNRLGDLSTFDLERLTEQLRELTRIDFPVEVTGFLTAEIDVMLDGVKPVAGDPADQVKEPQTDLPAITQMGDLWQLGKHRLLCGNALQAETYTLLLGDEKAQMVFTDPPYNVPIQGHVSGLGKARHAEFAMASGEMSSAAFTEFLATYMGHLVRHSVDGSIHFSCMDWRHLPEILAAAQKHYAEFKALCVWHKTNGGMGSLYRSAHEMVLVHKNGRAPHINNVELGKHGRYRQNVWSYAGANSFRTGRDQDLADHPTVKPVALVADAIRDCSHRNGLVLDPFAGSGTTILAAERTGRRGAAIELDPHYVDVAVRRWETHSKSEARLVSTGCTFAETAAARGGETADG